jgi:hypothetical protein
MRHVRERAERSLQVFSLRDSTGAYSAWDGKRGATTILFSNLTIARETHKQMAPAGSMHASRYWLGNIPLPKPGEFTAWIFAPAMLG